MPGTDAVEAIRARQADGTFVAFVADSAQGAAGFAACDLAIGLSSGRSSRFPARADLLAPDLSGLAAIVEAGARRELVARDAVGLSTVANIAGAVWGFRGAPGLNRASQAVYITALAALVDGWVRLKGGGRRGAAVARLEDPHPERWGRYSIDEVLHTLGTTADGLDSDTARARRQDEPASHGRNAMVHAVLDHVRSPLAAVLGAGAGLALVVGAPLDFFIIGATLGVNVAVGAWQERRAGQAAEMLAQLGAATARVIRAGEIVAVPAVEVVPGDVLVLQAGDRVAADARVLKADNLEVDEAALTGESLPGAKAPEVGTDASRVLLEGSDVTVGTGRAIVFAVGRGTRMGATAAALSTEDTAGGALGLRLSRMMRQLFPLAAAGGAIVVASGVIRGRALPSQLAIGASIAIAAVPEGLPLLTGIGQAAVAHRLAGRKAVVRRLTAVEALGRVDT